MTTKSFQASTITNANKSLRLLTLLSILFAMLAPLVSPSVTFAAITRSTTDFATASNTGDKGASSLAITAPAASVGDVLIAQIVVAKLDPTTHETVSKREWICPPSGWTSIRRTNSKTGVNEQSDIVQETFYRVVQSAESATLHTWEFKAGASCASTSSASKAASGGIVRYAGVASSPINASAGSRGSSSDAMTAPTVTTDVGGAQVIRLFGLFKNTDITGGASRIYHVAASNADVRAAAAFDAKQANAGATGEFSALWGTSGNAVWVAQTIALKPKADQTITFNQPTTPRTYGATFNVNPTASSRLAVTVTPSGGCTVAPAASGYDVTMTSGTTACVLTASQAGNNDYNAATNVARTVQAAKVSQAITFNALADKTFGDESFTVSATGGASGNPVTFAVKNATDTCTTSGENGSTVTITGAGSCTIVASQAGNDNYNAAPNVERSFSIAKASQVITFDALISKKFGDAPFTVAATGGGSGNLVTFAATSGSQCTVNGTEVTISGAGTCTIVASQAGNDNFLAAANVERFFTIAKADAQLALTNNTYTYDKMAKAVTVNTTPSGLTGVTVTYTDKNGDPVTSPTQAGTYKVQATLDNADYAAKPIIDGQLVIHPKELTGSFTAKDKTYDGNANAEVTGTSLVGFMASDSVTLNVASATFDTKDAGTDKKVTGNGFTLSGADADNYKLVAMGIGTTTASITPKTVTGAITASGKVYDGTTEAAAVAAAWPEGAIVGGDAVTLMVNNAQFDSKDAGTRTVTADLTLAGTEAGNYRLSSPTASAGATISKRAVEVTAAHKNKTYGDADPALTYSITAGTLVSGENFTGALSRTVGENVGSYAIGQGTLKLSDNYALTFNPASLTIDQRAVTVTADAKTKTYGEADPNLTYQITAGSLAFNDAFTGALKRAPGEDVNGSPYAIGQGTLDLSTNYALSFVGADLTIEKAGSTTRVTVSNATYTGDPHGGSAAVTGAGGLNQGLAVTYNGRNGTIYDSTTPPTNAGDYTASASFGGDDNHNGSADSANFSISKAGSMTIVTVSDAAYTGDPHGGTAAVTGAGDLDQSLTVTYSGRDGTTYAESTTPPTNVGDYTASASYAGDANHTDSNNSKNFSITKVAATVKVTGYTGAYDGQPHGATGSAKGVKGEDLKALLDLGAEYTKVPGGTADWTFEGDNNYNPQSGSVTIVIGEGMADITVAGFEGVYDGAAHGLTGSAMDLDGVTNLDHLLHLGAKYTAAGTYEVEWTFDGDKNHLPASGTKIVTITPRPITVTAADKSKTYGDADPTLTYNITSGTLVGNDGFTGALTRAAGQNVGSYAIGQGNLALSTNYALTFNPASLTISQRAITVTAADKTKTYGDADPALTYNITSGTLVGNDGFTGALTRAAGQNVGTYAIDQGTLTAGGNYNLSYVGANLKIEQRTLTVSADDKSKGYDGAAFTAFTASYNGFAPGENISNLSDALAFSGDAAGATNVGSYAIVPSGLTSSNYDIKFVNGTLTINQRAITVTAADKSKTYGDADPALTYSITAGTLMSGENFTGALSRTVGENVGSYAIGQGTLKLSTNYALTFNAGTLTISQRAVTVTAEAKTKVQGAAEPALTYNITSGSLVGSDAFSGALTRDPGEDPGSYAIRQGSLALSANYDLTYVGANLTISAPAPTWKLTGFYQPVGEANTYGTTSPASFVWNTVKGGSTVPLKFNILKDGAETSNTADVKSFTSLIVSCQSGAAVGTDPVETALLSTGGTSLRYSGTPGAGGQFIQNWQTPKVSSATCYRVTLTTQDGSMLVAFFQINR